MPGMTWTSQELLAGLEKAAARRQERLRWAEAEDRMGLLLEGQAIALAEEMAERTRT